MPRSRSQDLQFRRELRGSLNTPITSEFEEYCEASESQVGKIVKPTVRTRNVRSGLTTLVDEAFGQLTQIGPVCETFDLVVSTDRSS